MSFAISTEHKAIVVNHPGLTDKLLLLPGSKPLSDDPRLADFVIVPHTLDNAMSLRALNIEVPSPIGYYYDWPKVNGVHEVSQHQKEIAAFSTLFKRSYDLSEVGTRKTHSHLLAADYLMETGQVRKTLILSPLSTLTRVWGDAIFFTFPEKRTGVVLHGTAAKRRKLFKEDHDFYIINHDGLSIITDKKHDARGRLISAELMRDDIDLVIVDEGAEYRNSDTAKYALLRKVLGPDRMVHWLTGTPTPNAPTDAWAQARIVSPDRVPPYFGGYRDRTMRQLTQYRWEPRAEATQVVHQTLQPAIRYERSQVIPINEAVYSERECVLTSEQKKHYDELKKDLSTIFASGQKLSVVNQGVLRSKLLQAACGVIYDKNGETVVLDAKPRHDVVREVVRQCGEKVIVFVPFRHALEQLHKAVSKDFTCELVHGGVSSGKRNDIFLRFQNEHDPRVLIADARCMSHGLTLTEASTILWYAPPPSNNVYVQANGRITRDGQVNIPNIVHITGTPAERAAYQRVIDNGTQQDLLLNMVTAVGNKPLNFNNASATTNTGETE